MDAVDYFHSHGVTAVGDGEPVTLTDGEPPADKAFYRVEVSVP